MRLVFVFILLALALPAPARAQPVVAEPGWSLLRSISFDNPVAGILYPADNTIYVLRRGSSSDGLYELDLYGNHTRIGVSSNPAGLVADPVSGGLYWSGDYEGRIYRVQPGNPLLETWVNGFHAGDDDPFGLVIVPMSYADSVVAPGDGLVVDRGYSGPNEVWRWSPATPEGETAVHTDDGTLVDSFDITADDNGIFLVDSGATADGAIYELRSGGALIPFATSIPLPDPTGITIDPRNGDLVVLDQVSDTVHRVDRLSGTVTDIVNQIPVGSGWGGVDLSVDGTLMLVTNFNGDVLYLYGRCDATGSPELDCDGNGVIDECDILSGAVPDCNGNGVPDSCDLASGTSEDCNNDGVPDDCPSCPPVELAFIMDTSTSMDDEASALCNSLAGLGSRLEAAGLSTSSTLFGICNLPGGAYSCLQLNLSNHLGTAVPGSPPPELAVLGDCPGGSEVCQEDWGRATAVVAGLFPWQPADESVRLVIPVSDEGAWCGSPSTQIDTDATTLAAVVAQDHGVVVSPITGTRSGAAVLAQAQALADSTGGTAFSSSTPDQDLADGIYELVVAACTSASDCNDNGTLDACDISGGASLDENNDGIPDECQAPVGIDVPRPGGLGLRQNSPNPFNPSTTLRFDLPRPMEVELEIVGVDGRRVRVLHAGWLAAGPQHMNWDGRDATGQAVASGVYYARLRGGDLTERVRMVLLK